MVDQREIYIAVKPPLLASMANVATMSPRPLLPFAYVEVPSGNPQENDARRYRRGQDANRNRNATVQANPFGFYRALDRGLKAHRSAPGKTAYFA